MVKKVVVVIAAVVVILVGVGLHYALTMNKSTNQKLAVFSADAYLQESNTFLNSFKNSTGSSFLPVKSGGSYDMAGEIAQGETATNFISVALSSYNQSYLGSHYSGWAVAFAIDHLALTYYNGTGESSLEKSIVHDLDVGYSTNNTTLLRDGYYNLTSGKVKVGISDPLSDPAGYRGWLSLEVSGKLLENNTSYYSSRLTENGGNVTASSAADLVAPLETGTIQFLFIYRSAAIAKGMSYLKLSNQTNFGDPELTDFYSNFTLSYGGTTFTGGPVYLFISVPAGEPYYNLSMNFTMYVIAHNNLVDPYGLDPLAHCILYNSTTPPSSLSKLISSGSMTYGGPV